MTLTFGQPIPEQRVSWNQKAFIKRCKDERPDLHDKPLEFITYVNSHPDRMADIRPDSITRYMRSGI